MNLDEAMELFSVSFLDSITNGNIFNQHGVGSFLKFYIFSNERLDVVLRRMNLEGKTVLTTGSSGDQLIYAWLNGAKQVKVFDVCPFTKYYIELKFALIRNLSFEEMSNIMKDKYGMFNIEAYRKVSYDLPFSARMFWDNAYLLGFNHTDFDVTREKDKWNHKCEYLKNPEEYAKIQAVLREKRKIEFLNCDLRDLPDMLNEKERYDFILLSNIVKYSKYWNQNLSRAEGLREYFDILQKLTKNLNAGGVFQIDYRYHDCLKQLLKYKLTVKAEGFYSSTISPTEGAILYRPERVEIENE